MFTIRQRNSAYLTNTVFDRVDSFDDVRKSGLNGAVDIVADEMKTGSTSSSVLISIEDKNGNEMESFIVSISVSSLFINKAKYLHVIDAITV